jgi:methionyl-tRNA formyltransferase
MRVLFAGTPDFAVPALQALARDHEVVGVYTQPDRKAGRGKKLTAPPVKVVAQEHQFPVFQPDNLKQQESQIRSLAPDVMVVVAYGMILPKSILDIPEYGCINIHASILPRWRGAAPIQRAIEAGDKVTGVSIMQMAEGLDTGAVYEIFETPISEDDNAQSLHDRLSDLGAQGIISTLNRLQNEQEFGATEQDHDLASYAKKLAKAEGEIDWALGANQLANRIRAFNPWPVCYTEYEGERIRIWHAIKQDIQVASSDEKEASNAKTAALGEILSISSDGVLVQTGAGKLMLTKLQRQGGKPLNARDFLQGFELKVGDSFVSQ